MRKNYYDILGVDKNASLDEIKMAFRILAKKYHPDVNINGEETMKEIAEAYTVLSDSSKRKKYDFRENTRKSPNKDDYQIKYYELSMKFERLSKIKDEIISNFDVNRKDTFINEVEEYRQKLIKFLFEVNYLNLVEKNLGKKSNLLIDPVVKSLEEIDVFLTNVGDLEELYKSYEKLLKEYDYVDGYYFKKNFDVKILLSKYLNLIRKYNSFEDNVGTLGKGSVYSRVYLSKIDLGKMKEYSSNFSSYIGKCLNDKITFLRGIDFDTVLNMNDDYICEIIQEFGDGFNEIIYLEDPVISLHIDLIKTHVKCLRKLYEDKVKYNIIEERIDILQMYIDDLNNEINEIEMIADFQKASRYIDEFNYIDSSLKEVVAECSYFMKQYKISLLEDRIKRMVLDKEELHSIVHIKIKSIVKNLIKKLNDCILEYRSLFIKIESDNLNLDELSSDVKEIKMKYRLPAIEDLDILPIDSKDYMTIKFLSMRIGSELNIINELEYSDDIFRKMKYSKCIRKIVELVKLYRNLDVVCVDDKIFDTYGLLFNKKFNDIPFQQVVDLIESLIITYSNYLEQRKCLSLINEEVIGLPSDIVSFVEKYYIDAEEKNKEDEEICDIYEKTIINLNNYLEEKLLELESMYSKYVSLLIVKGNEFFVLLGFEDFMIFLLAKMDSVISELQNFIDLYELKEEMEAFYMNQNYSYKKEGLKFDDFDIFKVLKEEVKKRELCNYYLETGNSESINRVLKTLSI